MKIIIETQKPKYSRRNCCYSINWKLLLLEVGGIKLLSTVFIEGGGIKLHSTS